MKASPARILIPVDFTAPSAEALTAGYALAQRFGARVHVLHATTLPPFVDPALAVRLATDRATTTVEALALQEGARRLEALLAQHPAPVDIEVSHSVQFGAPLEVIQRQASAYDLVVLGTHGRTGFDHLFVGSVAERIIRHVDRPVLVARPPMAVSRILVPVDFSDCARTAYAYAMMLARRFDAELQLLHVVPSLPALESAELMVVQPDRETPLMALSDYARARAFEELDRFLSSVVDGRPHAVDVRMGDPATEIIEAAQIGPTDLIVMGTHGRTEWAWVGVGSVAERVVRQAPCSVLTTRWTSASTVDAARSLPSAAEEI